MTIFLIFLLLLIIDTHTGQRKGDIMAMQKQYGIDTYHLRFLLILYNS